jgi:hypothetical protein
VSGDAVHHPTWPLLLKIEHMVKLQVFGNNSKTVADLDMLNLFAVSTYHLSLIVFEIKDEKY